MKKVEKQNELKNFTVRFTDNDYMFDMLWVGNIIANAPSDRMNLSIENLEQIVKETMLFAFQIRYGHRNPNYPDALFKHLSNLDRFILINEAADDYLTSDEWKNQGQNLIVDFRLPKEQQVNIY